MQKKKKDFIIFSNGKRPLRVIQSNLSEIDCLCSLPALALTVDLLFVQFILVQPVFIQSISSNPNLT